MADLGIPAWRARQIDNHVFTRGEPDPHGWTDLPAGVREVVAARWFPPLLTPARDWAADRGETLKTAWRLHDGAIIESVLMRYPRRATVCVSSQAGCGMGCPFCATGQGGLRRNLSTAEIVAQVADAAARLASCAQGPLTRSDASVADGGAESHSAHLDNIVLMGMGEPLANYAAVLAGVRELIRPAPQGFGHSARGVTISTVGLVPQMERLAGEELPVTLAVSLHAPDDQLRTRLVPMNARWGVAAVLDAAWGYARATKRRVSIEYALMRDINDHPAQADELARQLTKRGDWTWAHVNLIPLNPTPGSPWTASRPGVQEAFFARLERAGVPVTVRDTRGSDIDGACGQLAATLA
jgi:23S rRNA (adenine2503-C2)-methyltransferase